MIELAVSQVPKLITSVAQLRPASAIALAGLDYFTYYAIQVHIPQVWSEIGTGSTSLFVQTCSGAIVDSCFGRAQAPSVVNLFRIVSFEGKIASDENFMTIATTYPEEMK